MSFISLTDYKLMNLIFFFKQRQVTLTLFFCFDTVSLVWSPGCSGTPWLLL